MIPHEWQDMPGYPGELFCCRCGLVKAFCGTDGCTARERQQYSHDSALIALCQR